MELKKKAKSNLIEAEMRLQIEKRIQEIEENIGNEIALNFHNEMIDTIRKLGGDETNLDGSGRNKMWKIFKKKMPKVKSAFPVGKKDQKGNIITNHIGLKNLYLNTYKDRLKNRPMKEDFNELKDLKVTLFNLRQKLCENRKSKPLKMEHLDAAIKILKKARDPNG